MNVGTYDTSIASCILTKSCIFYFRVIEKWFRPQFAHFGYLQSVVVPLVVLMPVDDIMGKRCTNYKMINRREEID